MMKAHRVLALITLLSYACLRPAGAYSQSKDAVIKSIRQSVQKIDNIHNLKIIKLENEEFVGDEMPDNGASLSGYFNGNELLKIHTWIGLSACIRQYDYYLVNGKLCFVYETEQDFEYDDKGNLRELKLTNAFEGRYYI